MTTQGGLKHATTDPAHLDKRERRRGASAAGRAAVLRRAPSDSDCSGETASLSADSGDRVAGARAPPPGAPPRQARVTKTRGRRRGSEWEVLEGLKDGQRYDRRPEVFNGYLHKKRKWPLKGWHKRFFVVDGGILVYARSPTDVARGRLHGSVDVGLSVISAKARRRRIDIDADEFIYHLRAKTPDVFWTWLNVLKVHRLYRQHLLTFGAREPVPKIHAPLEEQPPTDASSRTSNSCVSTTSLNEEAPTVSKASILSPSFSQKIACYHTSSIYHNKSRNPIDNWYRDSLESADVVPLTFEPLEEKNFDIKNDHFRSMCSMNCMARMYKNENEIFKTNKSRNLFMGAYENEKQMHSTDLDLRSLRSTEPPIESSLLYEYSFNYPSVNMTSLSTKSNSKENCKIKTSSYLEKTGDPTTALWFFAKNRSDRISSPTDATVMKRSKKCTNLVKYRNLAKEPPLKRPFSRSMLLGKYKLKISRHTGAETPNEIIKMNNEIQVEIENKENKSLQDTMTLSEYDKITERLLISLFGIQNADLATSVEVKYYLNQIVKELYEAKFSRKDTDPIQTLFKSLLEYWLKNTSGDYVKEAINRAKAIDKQSNKYFTKDKKLSGAFTANVTKETQLTIGDALPNPSNLKANEKKNADKSNSESFEKERRIQELERLLKNTVYICETVRSCQSKEKDIEITKKLIDNLEKMSRNETNNSNDSKENSNSSTELPKMQETINHLISETSIPPDVAKEFLGAYLDVLLHDTSNNDTESGATSGEDSKCSQEYHPLCEVQTESVQKKFTKSVTAFDKKSEMYLVGNNKVTSDYKQHTVDPGQLYLRDILDRITTIFNKVKKTYSEETKKKKAAISQTKINDLEEMKDELGELFNKYPGKTLISENREDNSVIINLSKYDLENISMLSDQKANGIMSITIQLKEKPTNFGKSKPANLNLKFSNDKPKSIKTNKTPSSNLRIPYDPHMNFKSPYLDFCAKTPRDKIDLKPFVSSSDATSKAYYQVMHESEHSLDLSFRSNNSFQKETLQSQKSLDGNEDAQSCYVISTFKKSSLAAKFQSRKKVRMKERNGIVRKANGTPSASSPSQSPDLSVFENPAPKMIDEKFILLLLENLTLLSSTIPSLHKEINNLYLKLRKRHEKVAKHSTNVQGLGLLGKIYNDESKKSSNDNETQFDVNITAGLKDLKEASVNTSRRHLIEKIFADQCLSAYVITKEVTDRDVQTERNKLGLVMDFGQMAYITTKNVPLIEIKKDVSVQDLHINIIKPPMCSPAFASKNKPLANHNFVAQTTSLISAPSIEEVATTDRGISNTNLNEQGRNQECNLTNAIKCIFEKADSGKNFRFVAPKQVKAFRAQNDRLERDLLQAEKEMAKRTKNDRRRSPKVTQDLIKEIRLLSPSFKVSTQSQTDKPLTHLLKETQKDFNVYQLFLSKIYDATKSNSVTDSSIELQKSDDLKTIYRCSSYPSYCSGLLSPTSPPMRGPQAGFVSGTPGGRLASWILESGGPLENASRELGQAQLSVQQLQRLLNALELQHQVHHDTDVSLEGASPNVKKDRRKFGLRKKKSNSKCASVELAPPHLVDPSGSHMALSALTAPPSPGGGASSVPNSAASLPIACAAARPQSLPGAESLGAAAGPASLTSLTPDQQLREDFTVLAKDLLATLKGVVSTLVCERGRLRAAMDAADTTPTPGGAVVAALRTNLSSALQQNSELRSRLSRIHDASDLAEMSSVNNSDPQANRPFQQSLSYSSSCVSASEFFDAEEHEDDDLKAAEILPGDEAGVIELDGDSSSEAGSLSSEEGSASSDNSDGAMLSAEPISLLARNGHEPRAGWARRTCLPCPRPTPGGPSLWNLLYKNIGKDLSQISMPVTINEPLNMLQRLCEELEYSELLDAASECRNAVERMALIAAFAVSAYASSAHRAASKPFNPLLAETYECVRDDRGFRFLAEQVSHHPPISACHAESPRWCFWQEARIKTKFWGKSMEFQPTGRVHVRLVSTGDHYSWNKVTTCVHNLFGGQRWVDQYGDMHITCHGTDISCKLNFIKASSWSSSRHEVRGAVTEGSSGTRLRLQGRWSEALYAGEPPAARCLWRPGAMPPEHEMYYGFTRFAMELNELEPGMRELLPNTDTRLRPDQRALEEGDVESAEQYKHELEQAQRERRRDSPEHTPAWFRKTLEGGEETWVFSGEYWKAREAGFGPAAPRIW